MQILWETLNHLDREREDALLKALERQEKLDLLKRRFNNKIEKLEAWTSAKHNYLITEEQVDSFNKAQVLSGNMLDN